jgi:hypothetical protein
MLIRSPCSGPISQALDESGVVIDTGAEPKTHKPPF